MRQEAIISLGHITFLGWDSGRGCCRWGRTPILQPWPHCWSGCSNMEHSSHIWWPCCRLFLPTEKWNSCLANEFRSRVSKLPKKWGLISSSPRAERFPCGGCATGPTVKPIVGRTPLHWGRGRRKESWALICSICSAAANWIEGAEGKTLDTAFRTSSFPEQSCFSTAAQHLCPNHSSGHLPARGAELNIGNTTHVNPTPRRNTSSQTKHYQQQTKEIKN